MQEGANSPAVVEKAVKPSRMIDTLLGANLEKAQSLCGTHEKHTINCWRKTIHLSR